MNDIELLIQWESGHKLCDTIRHDYPTGDPLLRSACDCRRGVVTYLGMLWERVFDEWLTRA
jgi:hypothetical protein